MRLSIISFVALIGLNSCKGGQDYASQRQKDDAKIRMKIQNECKEEDACYIEAAKEDFKSKDYRLFTFGLMDDDAESNYYACLEVNRKIDVIWAGDVGPFLFEKYNETMIALIRANWGNDYFDSCNNGGVADKRRNQP